MILLRTRSLLELLFCCLIFFGVVALAPIVANRSLLLTNVIASGDHTTDFFFFKLFSHLEYSASDALTSNLCELPFSSVYFPCYPTVSIQL